MGDKGCLYLTFNSENFISVVENYMVNSDCGIIGMLFHKNVVIIFSLHFSKILFHDQMCRQGNWQ